MLAGVLRSLLVVSLLVAGAASGAHAAPYKCADDTPSDGNIQLWLGGNTRIGGLSDAQPTSVPPIPATGACPPNYRLLQVTDANLPAAVRAVYNCIGTSSTAWVGSYNGDTHSKNGLLFTVTQSPTGSVDVGSTTTGTATKADGTVTIAPAGTSLPSLCGKYPPPA